MIQDDVFNNVDLGMQRQSFVRRICAFGGVADVADLHRTGLVSQRVLDLDTRVSSMRSVEDAYSAVMAQMLQAEETPVFAEMALACATRYAAAFDVAAFRWMQSSFVDGVGLALVLSRAIWQDIVGDADFVEIYEPCESSEIVATGVLGALDGVTMLTDAYRLPTAQTIPAGAAFMCRVAATDKFADVRTWRGPLTAPVVGGRPGVSTFEHKLSLSAVKPGSAVRFQRVTGS